MESPRRSTSQRGYGTAHQAARRRVAQLVASGLATCARCGESIEPGAAWDLDHMDDRAGYLDPSHQRCNRGQGARNGAAATNARRRSQTGSLKPGYARSWSRVWSWPIPPDTYVDPDVVRAYLEQDARRGEEEPQLP